MKYKFLICSIFILSFDVAAQAPSRNDYQRAVSFLWSNLINKKIFNIHVQPIWFKDSTGLVFITQDRNKKIFNKLVFKSKKVESWFDHDRMAKVLSDSLRTAIKSNDLPIQGITNAEKNHFDFNYKGDSYTVDLNNYSLQKKSLEEENELESTSPDGKWLAYTDRYNLFIKSTADHKIKQLSTNGERYYEYGTYYGWSDIIEGENGERPKRVSIYWSPDSKWIQTYVCDFRNAKKMYLLDWSIDTLFKPKLLSYYRGSPGDTDMVRLIPAFYNIETGEEYIKNELQSTHTNPIDYEWTKSSGIIDQKNTIRGYQAVEYHRCDLNKKTSEQIYRETSKTNIDNFNSHLIESWNKIIFTSERSGWKQLYAVDLMTKIITPLTDGEYYVNEILRIDTLRKSILFTASGKEIGRNPYHQYLYRLNLVDNSTELLTPENANHDVSISPDENYIIDNISTVNQATKTFLKSIKGASSSIEISRANITMLDSIHYTSPEIIQAIGRDGHSELYGALWKPIRFDPKKSYPIIDQSYTGPHTFMFPRNFTSSFSRSNQALAELGFIVITIDGMGTANRSKAFHDVSYKNMGKNLEDHRLAILQLGRKYAWIDTTRVGIFGHSAGGYDAGHAVLEYPDFYKVAVASSADHDFRMEKDWWPEMYMGWPVDSTYQLVSNITMAANLKGKLLITHGGIDENVNPSATFKLAEALIKANKEFDMLILPSQRHGYQGMYNEYFTKKKWNYFVEHLLGAQPIWDIDMK